MRSLVPDTRTEDGSVLVAATIIIAALVLLSVGIIQVGAWFQDRRHLQVRADAGALAGAQFFNECFVDPSAGVNPKADMEKAASQYAGFTAYQGNPLAGSFAPAYNTGENTGSNAIAFQSKTYPGGGGDAPDDTNTATECDPSNLGLDVKLTRDVGGLFSITPFGHIHAHARVQLKEVQSLVPSFPLAVPEIVPNAVGVTFVNEDTGAELTGCSGADLVASAGSCTFKLQDSGNTGPGTDPFGLGPWVTPSASVNLPNFAAGDVTAAKHIGMRVGVGNVVQSCAGAGDGTMWQCYNADANALSHGIVMIDEVNPAQTAPVQLLGVWPTTCAGSPFAGSPSLTSPCAATITAKIDFGASFDPTKTTVTATVTQIVDKKTNKTQKQTFALSYNAGTGLWSAPLATTTAAVNINPPDTGNGSEYTIDLSWQTTGKSAGNGTWPGVQRFVGATTSDDGPLSEVSLSDAGAPNGPYSYVGGGSRSVGVRVVLKAPFNTLSILRQSFDGSATSFILCRWKDPANPGLLEGGDPGIKDGIRYGCNVPYTIKADASVACVAADETPTNLTPDCTQNKPMTSGGNPIASQLDLRFGCSNGTAVHKNLWPDYGTPGDPRAVTLITTSFGAFDKNGNNNYPVTGFGAFYIAGYSGNSCGDKWPVDASGNPILGPEPKANSGTIWGYFIKYTNNDATPSGVQCKVNSFNHCVAVLTR
jgi:hypothetical protein